MAPDVMSTTATRRFREPSATNASPVAASNPKLEAPPNVSVLALFGASVGPPPRPRPPRPPPRPPRPPPRAAPLAPVYAVSMVDTLAASDVTAGAGTTPGL